MNPGPTTTGPIVRIGDADREQLATALGRHLTAGRLSLTEFEDRIEACYAATTRGDADLLLADLPAADPPTDRSPRPAGSRRRGARVAWAPWALTGVICLLVWVATSLVHGRPLEFWPGWVIGPWGLVLLAKAAARSHGTPRGCDGGQASARNDVGSSAGSS